MATNELIAECGLRRTEDRRNAKLKMQNEKASATLHF